MRRTRAIGAVAAASVLLAGCGGGNSLDSKMSELYGYEQHGCERVEVADSGTSIVGCESGGAAVEGPDGTLHY